MTTSTETAAALDPALSHVAETPRPQAVSKAESADDARRAGNPSLISPTVVRGTVRAVEAAGLAALGLFAAILTIAPQERANEFGPLWAIPFCAVATVVAAELFGLYRLGAFSSAVRSMPRLVMAWTLSVAGMILLLVVLGWHAELPRLWLASWFLGGILFLGLSRVALSRLVKRWARNGTLYQRVVIYGAGDVTAQLIAQMEADTDSDVRIAGIFDDRIDERVRRQISAYAHLGGLDDLVAFCRSSRVDMVIVSLPVSAENRLGQVLRRLSVLPADVKLPAFATGLRFTPRTYSHLGKVAMIDLLDRPIADWSRVQKWLFDKIIASVALVLLAPVLAAVAIAVRLDSRGPILFRQRRYGFNNELIEVLKFRSMYTDRCDHTASKLVTKGDPRVTPVGRFIRKTSLDELPQLFNVLKGELSLVGPRPHATQAKAADQLYDDVVDGYFARHKVKPGITGWAQINGWRGETDTQDKIQKRVEHDLYYIENWSVFLDLYILLKTPWSLVATDNAY